MLVEDMEKELRPEGNVNTLGELFDENHALLSSSGVSCHSIERVRKIARENGALGSKLTGAGGNGGCVLILSASGDARVIRAAIERQDFRCFDATFSHRGAGTDGN
jgi:mevalonate kinase